MRLRKNTVLAHLKRRERQEIIVQSECGDIDWTIVRPGGLSNGALDPSQYRAGACGGGITGYVTRANLAHCLLQQLDDEAFHRMAIAVAK